MYDAKTQNGNEVHVPLFGKYLDAGRATKMYFFQCIDVLTINNSFFLQYSVKITQIEDFSFEKAFISRKCS